jgi:ubiquitin-protein ligase
VLQVWKRSPLEGLAVVEGDQSEWTVRMNGAEGSLYEGESYLLSVKFGARYPLEAPDVSTCSLPCSALDHNALEVTVMLCCWLMLPQQQF